MVDPQINDMMSTSFETETIEPQNPDGSRGAEAVSSVVIGAACHVLRNGPGIRQHRHAGAVFIQQDAG
ncbi:hypothetical protein C357_08181 [Citreicella sp. 357]|nr:hypothetical protein C357_08181 [Citreicella sp. 357]